MHEINMNAVFSEFFQFRENIRRIEVYSAVYCGYFRIKESILINQIFKVSEYGSISRVYCIFSADIQVIPETAFVEGLNVFGRTWLLNDFGQDSKRGEEAGRIF